jgi:hypothetical protein
MRKQLPLHTHFNQSQNQTIEKLMDHQSVLKIESTRVSSSGVVSENVVIVASISRCATAFSSTSELKAVSAMPLSAHSSWQSQYPPLPSEHRRMSSISPSKGCPIPAGKSNSSNNGSVKPRKTGSGKNGDEVSTL